LPCRFSTLCCAKVRRLAPKPPAVKQNFTHCLPSFACTTSHHVSGRQRPDARYHRHLRVTNLRGICGLEVPKTGEQVRATRAQKVDDVRAALRRGDIQAAGQLARVYHLAPGRRIRRAAPRAVVSEVWATSYPWVAYIVNGARRRRHPRIRHENATRPDQGQLTPDDRSTKRRPPLVPCHRLRAVSRVFSRRAT
jgi:hypothetical protein